MTKLNILCLSKVGKGRWMFMADDHYQVMAMRQCLRREPSSASHEPVTYDDRLSNRFRTCLFFSRSLLLGFVVAYGDCFSHANVSVSCKRCEVLRVDKKLLKNDSCCFPYSHGRAPINTQNAKAKSPCCLKGAW